MKEGSQETWKTAYLLLDGLSLIPFGYHQAKPRYQPKGTFSSEIERLNNERKKIDDKCRALQGTVYGEK
jgi:hypothetical protein